MAKYIDIFEAIRKNDIEAVKTFLPDSLELKDRLKYEWTPLHWACFCGHIEIVRLLLDNGANIEARDNYGKTPFHQVCWCIGKENNKNKTEMVYLLFNRGSDINAKDYGGNIPLHYACMSGCLEIISLLLELNVDIEAKDNEGFTPLHKTCFYKRHKESEFLVIRGANPFVKNKDGESALYYDKEMVKDKDGHYIPHSQILVQLRAEYLNKHAVEASERTAALSSGWEMEM